MVLLVSPKVNMFFKSATQTQHSEIKKPDNRLIIRLLSGMYGM